MTSCSNYSDLKKMTSGLDSLFNTMYSPDAPGAAVLILKEDKVLYDKGFGLADMDKGTKIDGNTFFNIASVSKQFSSVALLKLNEEGKLSLDDPISKFFPEFKADFYNNITLKHLLSHTSGIPDARPRTDRDFVLYATDVQSYGYLKDLDRLNFEPGSHYEYMNPTYQLIYTIVERVSGYPFEEYMREFIFTPSSMEEALYFEASREIPRMAHGYIFEDQSKRWKEYDYGEETFFASKADGGIYTSTHEFVKWEKSLRNNLVISEESRELAHSKHVEISGSSFSSYQNRPYTWYGYGWFIEERPDFVKKIYHTGDNGGFQIYAGRYPDSEILILIFENRNDHSRWDTVTKVEEIINKNGYLIP